MTTTNAQPVADTDEHLMCLKTASTWLGVSVTTVRRLVEAGKLACTRVGDRLMFSKRAMREFIAENTINKKY